MRIPAVIQSTVRGFSENECFTRAAALAYYSVFSLPSALVIVIYIAGLMYGRAAAAGEISSKLGSFVGPEAGKQIQEMISNAGQHQGTGLVAGLIALGALIIASTTAFAELQQSLDRAWNVEPDDSSVQSMTGKRVTSFLMVIGAGIVLLASMMFGTVMSAFGNKLPFHLSTGVMYASAFLVPWIIISLLVAAMFKALPDARVQWRDVAVGAIVTAALLIVAKFGMSIYLSRASVGSSYGAASSLAILLLWLFISAAILLLGAEFTRAWAREHGRDVQPSLGAHRVVVSRRAA
jgi:membrane protein